MSSRCGIKVCTCLSHWCRHDFGTRKSALAFRSYAGGCTRNDGLSRRVWWRVWLGIKPFHRVQNGRQQTDDGKRSCQYG